MTPPSQNREALVGRATITKKKSALLTGFQRTLDAVSDLVLDVPKAVDDLITFVARAKLEGIVSNSFFKRDNDISETGRQIKDSALEAISTKKDELKGISVASRQV